MNFINSKTAFTTLLSENNLSQRTISRLAGISPALLTMMRKGQRTFQLKHKENMAMILGYEEQKINWYE